jgi:ABC-type nitrate/sulfonate/bicarbonate transport system permease component
MNISSKDIFTHQIFPQLLDSFFSNMRIIGSIIIALIVIAEMYIGQETGIGKALSNARNNYNWANFYSYIIITGIVGMVLNYFIDRLHKTYTTK